MPTAGIIINSANNQIGGDSATERNVVAGNGQRGLLLNGGGASGNVITGNYIGTDSSGLAARGNGAWGIDLIGAGSGNIIGGDTVAEANVIAATPAWAASPSTTRRTSPSPATALASVPTPALRWAMRPHPAHQRHHRREDRRHRHGRRQSDRQQPGCGCLGVVPQQRQHPGQYLQRQRRLGHRPGRRRQCRGERPRRQRRQDQLPGALQRHQRRHEHGPDRQPEQRRQQQLPHRILQQPGRQRRRQRLREGVTYLGFVDVTHRRRRQRRHQRGPRA